MANSGPHTNGSQFFILYKSANHLNYKHTVFGGIVGGLTTLAVMEKVPVDDNDQPLEEIKITSITVFVNPYLEPDDEEEDKNKEGKETVDKDNDKVGSWYSNPGTGTETAVGGGGVGKYLKSASSSTEAAAAAAATVADMGLDANAGVSTKKRKVAASNVEFKNFSSW